MLNSWLKSSVILLLVGATIGTLLDGAHTHTNTIQYASPVFWLAAWWTPLVFANGSLMTGLSRPLAEKIWHKAFLKPSWREVIACNGLFYLAYILSGYLPWSVVVKTGVLIFIWILMWVVFDRTFLGLGLSVLTAVIGPLFERGLVELELFWYVEPNFFGVTSWLPVLYAIAALGSGKLGLALVHSFTAVKKYR